MALGAGCTNINWFKKKKKNHPKVHAAPYSSLKQVYLLLNITKLYGTSFVVLKAPKEIQFDNNNSIIFRDY